MEEGDFGGESFGDGRGVGKVFEADLVTRHVHALALIEGSVHLHGPSAEQVPVVAEPACRIHFHELFIVRLFRNHQALNKSKKD